MLVCCGAGIGSSFMLEMNIKKVLKELNITSMDVDHGDLELAKEYKADIYVATKELASRIQSDNGEIISLNNIFDINEIKEKILKALENLSIV